MKEIGLLIFLETIAASLLKEYTINKTTWKLLIAILIYPLVAYMFATIIKSRGLAVANAMWQIGALVIISLWGVIYYKEKLTSMEMLGLGFGVLGLLLFNFKDLKKLMKI